MKDSTEGYLASLLIYQQLTEEILKLLVRYSNLLIQCSVFPQEIKFKDPNGLMFGQVIGLLEGGLSDEETKKLIKVCKDFGQLRNRIAHRITLKTDVADIRRQARQAKKYYDTIYASYKIIIDNYRLALREYHKNHEDYKELVEETIEEEKSAKKVAKSRKSGK
jgi:hypothetical protein